MSQQIEAIILAAGKSSRMAPQDKLLLNVEGQPMLRKVALDVLASSVARCHVILPATGFDKRFDVIEDLPVHPAHLPEKAEIGMGHSLAYAAGLLSRECQGVMVVLADMPCLSAGLIKTLIKHSQSDRITIPQFEGRRGHPVLFGSDFIPDLSQMSGDIGARELINAHSNSIDLIEMTDNGCLLDLDNAEDWRSYQASRD